MLCYVVLLMSELDFVILLLSATLG